MVMDKFAMLYLWLNMKWMIKKFILLFCLMMLLPVSAPAAFKGLHPLMGIEPELIAPPIEGMVFVKGGCYEMGDTFGDGYENERPVHTVCVDDFYIGKYEVTKTEWFSVLGNNPSMFKGCDNCHVEKVSWDDVQGFIERQYNKSGRKFRLPTEVEWEYAARSGGKKEKFAGFSDEDQLYLYANFCDINCEYDHKTISQDDRHKNTSPVGNYRSNGLGLYDMTGDVWEWVSDWFAEDYYKKSPMDNPKGPDSGKEHVLRGGSWNDVSGSVSASLRAGFELMSDRRSGNAGFRLALSPPSTADFTAECEKADTLIREANSLITKDPAKAESLYQDAVKLCPYSASAHYNLGLARFNKGDFSSANISFKEALMLNPNSVEAMNGLALSYASQGINYDESKALIENALKSRPDDSILKESVSLIEASRKPPYIIADLVIEDSDGNNILDAGEDVVFRFSVENKGKGAAINLMAKSDAPEFLKELKDVGIGNVMPG